MIKTIIFTKIFKPHSSEFSSMVTPNFIKKKNSFWTLFTKLANLFKTSFLFYSSCCRQRLLSHHPSLKDSQTWIGFRSCVLSNHCPNTTYFSWRFSNKPINKDIQNWPFGTHTCLGPNRLVFINLRIMIAFIFKKLTTQETNNVMQKFISWTKFMYFIFNRKIIF